jgi:hypothetical protein
MKFLIVASLGYFTVVALIVAGLVSARNSAIQSLGGVEARQAWEDWRTAAESQNADRPVSRSVPRSGEPPALLLLRDHFAACLVGMLAMATPLYWTLVLFVRGVMSGPAFDVQDHQETNGRH